MKLISLNVALFETNNTLLSQFLKKQNADFLCLQEVTRAVDSLTKPEYVSKDTIDQTTTHIPYSFFAPSWVTKNFDKTDFHQHKKFTIDFGGFLEFGNYVKTHYPIIRAKNVFIENDFTYITDWAKWPEEDYRAVQVLDISLNQTQKFRLLNYHGIWTRNKQGNSKTIAACEKINEMATEVNYPVIITGDFNLFPDTESIKKISKNFTSLVDTYSISRTRPLNNELSHLERNVVDYIFVSKDVKINSFSVLDSLVSDHLPLVLDFNI